MNVLIVDDEPLARSRLQRMVSEIEGYEVSGEAGDGKTALMKCSELNPDIVLLDIRMPGMDGLEAAMHLANLPNPPAIIFTTAFSEHALAAFDAQAVDYVLKPIRPDRLTLALGKAHKLNRAQLMEVTSIEEHRRARTHISAQISGNIQLVSIEDILFFQAEQKYVTVRHLNGEVLIDEPLKDLEQEFSERFLRIHRSTLVAKQHIEKLSRDGQGQWVIHLHDCDHPLEISRRLLTVVRKQLKQASR